MSVSRSPCSLFVFLPLAPLREYWVQCTAQVFRGSSGPGFLSKCGAQAVPRLVGLRPPFSSLMYALLRVVDSPEGRCCAYFRRLLPNVSAAYISYVISFPRVEIQLRGITSI
jgi:hypothetical protein